MAGSSLSPAPVINAMTVDVEDYFQVSAFEPHVDRSDWSDIPCRVEANTCRILELFASRGVKATFFTLGWVAERFPQLPRLIVEQGHELASHGWEHRRVNSQSPGEFRADVERTRKLLEDLSGVAVIGYRAASYSLGKREAWAWRELSNAGYEYSSSIAPVKHDHYGIPGAPRFAFRPNGSNLLEIPITTVALGGRNLNCAGGGWFRLFPYAFSRWALSRVNEEDGESGIFYFHPWEIDPDQPRMANLDLRTRFRHYVNLRRTYSRLDRLLDDFQWDRVDRVFLSAGASA